MEMTREQPTAWVATRRDELVILAEYHMTDKVLAIEGDKQHVSVVTGGKVTLFGDLLRVDMSPDALIEDLDIQEGQRILLLPKASRRRAVESSAGP